MHQDLLCFDKKSHLGSVRAEPNEIKVVGHLYGVGSQGTLPLRKGIYLTINDKIPTNLYSSFP